MATMAATIQASSPTPAEWITVVLVVTVGVWVIFRILRGGRKR